MSWLFFAICILSMPLAAEMAGERGRSRQAWLLIGLFVGPLAPLALALLGDAKSSAS